MPIPIYVIGSSNTDMVVRVDKHPLPGETVMGGVFYMNAGGKGANQAVAAARLGAEVFFVVHIGNDVFGKQSLQQFQNAEHINISLATIDMDHPSGVALIVVDANGENSITVAPGSNHYLDVKKVELALKDVVAPAIVLIQMEIPMASIEYAIQTSYAKGLQVILNPAPAEAINPSLLKNLQWITPNESEAEVLTGIRVTDIKSAAEAAKKLRDQGVLNVVITLGSKGAYLHTETIEKLIVAVPVKAVVDTTAAGDCFNGALAVALAENKPIEEAVAFACCAASISVTRPGAQASLPHRQEVNILFDSLR